MKCSMRVDQYSVDCFFLLVFPYQTAWQYSDGDSLTRASNAVLRFLTSMYSLISTMIQAILTMAGIESRMFERRHFQ